MEGRTMYKKLLYAGYGYMAFSAVMNYLADVVQPYLRRLRPASPETTLYYGLHTGFNFGQAMFGLTALLLLLNGADFFSRRSGEILTLFAITGWFAISFAFTTFAPPKINLAIVLALLATAAFLNK